MSEIYKRLLDIESTIVAAHKFFTGVENNRARIWVDMLSVWSLNAEEDEIAILYTEDQWTHHKLRNKAIHKENMLYILMDNGIDHTDPTYVILSAGMCLLNTEQIKQAWEEAE